MVRGVVQVTSVDTMRAKLIGKGSEQAKTLSRALDQLLHLIRH